MDNENQEPVHYLNNWSPLTNDKVATLKSLISKIQYALKLAESKLNLENLEDIHAEIDAQIIVTSNWLSKNKIPKSFWLNDLNQCAKTIGKLKKIVEYHLSHKEYGSFMEVSNFYGNLVSNPPTNEYNEEQYIDFLQHFNGNLDLELTFFENKFDDIDKKLIYKHFSDNLVNTGYIENSILKKFLVMAFDTKVKPEEKFDFVNNPSKQSIRKIFNDYENKISKRKIKHRSYVELLSNYFNGYNYENTNNNWNR